MRSLVFVGIVGASLCLSFGIACAQEPTDAKVEAAPRVSNVDVHVSSEVDAYADTDHVFVVSPSIAGSLSNPVTGWKVGGRYLVDVVSAASVDIVSTASRRWEEVRHAGSVDGSYKLGDFGVGAGGVVSIEPDYQSYAGGGSITRDLLDKNLTLLVGYSHGHDIGGRTGTPFSVFSRTLDINGFKGGATVLVSASTLVSLVGDVIHEAGDPSKPYRYVPLFAPGTQLPLGASAAVVTQSLSARALEQLPLKRDRFSLSARLAHRFTLSTVRVDERVYIDTWGLKASTLDGRFIFDVGRRLSLGPHVRLHGQTSVDFWQRAYALRPGSDLPALRTGDRELGPLINVTGGGTIRYHVGPAANPRSWVLGVDLGLTSTHYLDDIYVTHRLSSIGALMMEVDL